MRNSTYYTTIPSVVRRAEDLSAQAKLVFGDIAGLAQKEGYCYASNEYIAVIADVTPRQVSRYVTELVKGGYLSRRVTENKVRELRILSPKVDNSGESDRQICRDPLDNSGKSDRQNCLHINKGLNNNINKGEKDASFLDLVTSYFVGRGVSPVDAEDMAHGFLAWHEENDTTHTGVTPTKFKARANTWYQNAKKYGKIEVEAKVLTKAEFADLMVKTKQQNREFNASEWELRNDHWHYTPHTNPKSK